MIPARLIAQKRDGEELSAEDIAEFISAYARGQIPDYQMSALAMAICIRGMTLGETVALTEQMLASGETLSWSSSAPKVDKHSTGGLGDKVSLILAPLLACFDLQVPMISGRGLGITGGTLDKLESIAGLRTDLSLDQMRRQTEEVGCVICAASDELAPADRKLYALRDVTGTVESIPLITASIMSKKLAASLDGLVLDVKFGSGAFMHQLDDARELADRLVDVGQRMGTKTTALLTDMNQPLGRAVGNALEVDESVRALAGDGPDDLMQLVFALSAELLLEYRSVSSPTEAARVLRRTIDNGRALEKFREMVRAQGGDLDATLPIAPSHTLTADRSGRVHAIDGALLGQAVIELGGGRKQLNDQIDRSVGLEMLVRIGDEVEQQQPLVRIHGSVTAAESLVRRAIVVQEGDVPALPLIVDRVSPAESSPRRDST